MHACLQNFRKLFIDEHGDIQDLITKLANKKFIIRKKRAKTQKELAIISIYNPGNPIKKSYKFLFVVKHAEYPFCEVTAESSKGSIHEVSWCDSCHG